MEIAPDISEQMEQKEIEYKYSLLGIIQKAGEFIKAALVRGYWRGNTHMSMER